MIQLHNDRLQTLGYIAATCGFAAISGAATAATGTYVRFEIELIAALTLGAVALCTRGTASVMVLLIALSCGEYSFELAGKQPLIPYGYFVAPLALLVNSLHNDTGTQMPGVRRSYLLAWGAYLVSIVPGILHSQEVAISLLRATWIISAFMAWMLVLRVANERNRGYLLQAAVVFGGLLAARFIFQMLAVVGWEYATNPHYRGIVNELPGFGRSNYIASFFVLLLPIAIGLATSTRRLPTRLCNLVLAALLLSGLLLTFSRGGLLAAGLAIGLLLLIDNRQRSRSTMLLLLGITAAVVIPLAGATLSQRLVSFDDNLRFSLWGYALSVFRANWLIGIGLGVRLTPPGVGDVGPLDPHNLIIGALVETGIIGATGLLLLVGTALRALALQIRSYRVGGSDAAHAGLYAGLLGGLAHTMIEPSMRGSIFVILFWTLMALAIFPEARRALPPLKGATS